MVEFTCRTRRSAENLAEALSTREEVTFARVRDPEYTDVKFHWVPSDFPDEKIQGVINTLCRDIRYSQIPKDRRGKANGRRIYNIKTERLKLKPIPSTVKLSGKTLLVEYTSQPIQCFLCKDFGHIKDDCPNHGPILHNAESKQRQNINQERHESASDKPSNHPETSHGRNPSAAQQVMRKLEMTKKVLLKYKIEDELIFQFPTIT